MARSRAEEAFGATLSGYAAGFLPVPLAVTTALLLGAKADSRTGSVSVLWVLLASIPAALILGPWNTRRTLIAYGDAHADETARATIGYGVVGLVVQALVLVPLLYIGWIGLVVDVAVPAAMIPGLARQRVLTKLDEARLAARLRGGPRRRGRGRR
ncbi:MAG TPA: hypothetical protein VHD81_09670 [Mycobacteriales bacterium]|nr:hypothetical protein [Mycobacteriales bacterium]